MDPEERFIMHTPEVPLFCLLDQYSEKKCNKTPVEKKIPEESETEHEGVLLKLNGHEIDEYLDKKTPSATESELRSLKLIRRKVKNREYAKASRDTAKRRTKHLKKICESLTKENYDLKQRILELENEEKIRITGYDF